MKYIGIIFLLAFNFGININAQSQVENTLELQSNFFGNKFYKGDTLIGINQVLDEMSSNEGTYNLMLSAKKDNVFAQILGATGGLLIGIPVGTALAGGDPKWALAGIGAGIIVVTIPISIKFKKKANKAILQHNNFIKNGAWLQNSPTYKLGFGSNGLNFQIRF